MRALRGSLLLLGACAGDVAPGAPLERMEEAPASAVDAGQVEVPMEDAAADAGQPEDASLSCNLPDDGRWLLQFTRDTGSCEDSVTVEMWAADEIHTRFSGVVGHGLFQAANGQCVLTYDVTFGDMRLIGYVELVDGVWVGNASGSRSVYEHSVLQGCSALYLVAEVEPEGVLGT